MYQNILLCTDGSPAADAAAGYAIWFGKKLNARLRALYVTDIRLLEGLGSRIFQAPSALSLIPPCCRSSRKSNAKKLRRSLPLSRNAVATAVSPAKPLTTQAVSRRSYWTMKGRPT